VYIRGLHPTTDDELLLRYTQRFGDVETSKAIIDTGSGACKGYVLVHTSVSSVAQGTNPKDLVSVSPSSMTSAIRRSAFEASIASAMKLVLQGYGELSTFTRE
jgi:hypothetical protein